MKRAILIVLAVACTCSMPTARAATAADSELELDNQEACLYDRVKVAWKSRQLPASHNGAWLSLFAAPAAASHDGSSSNPCSALRPFAMLNLGKRSGGDNNSSTSSSGSGSGSDKSLLLPPRRIECELDQRFCKVRFAAMEVNAVTAAAEETEVKYYDTTLRFTVGTNMYEWPVAAPSATFKLTQLTAPTGLQLIQQTCWPTTLTLQASGATLNQVRCYTNSMHSQHDKHTHTHQASGATARLWWCVTRRQARGRQSSCDGRMSLQRSKPRRQETTLLAMNQYQWCTAPWRFV